MAKNTGSASVVSSCFTRAIAPKASCLSWGFRTFVTSLEHSWRGYKWGYLLKLKIQKRCAAMYFTICFVVLLPPITSIQRVVRALVTPSHHSSLTTGSWRRFYSCNSSCCGKKKCFSKTSPQELHYGVVFAGDLGRIRAAFGSTRRTARGAEATGFVAVGRATHTP